MKRKRTSCLLCAVGRTTISLFALCSTASFEWCASSFPLVVIVDQSPNVFLKNRALQQPRGIPQVTSTLNSFVLFAAPARTATSTSTTTTVTTEEAKKSVKQVQVPRASKSSTSKKSSVLKSSQRIRLKICSDPKGWHLGRKSRGGGGGRQRWEKMIQKLKQFHEVNGHSLVKNETDSDDLELYKWTQNLRRNYLSQGRYLDPEKKKALDDLDFVWDVHALAWYERYEQLKEFWLQHGHCRVPKTYKKYPGLGVWVVNQRQEYRKLLNNNSSKGDVSSTSNLPPERIEALEVLDFMKSHDSKQKNVDSDHFDIMIRKLKRYYEKHGHSLMQKTKDPELYQWTQTIRMKYRTQVTQSNGKKFSASSAATSNNKPRMLCQEQLKKLKEVNFVWDIQSYNWNKRYKQLKDFWLEHGHCRVPQSCKQYPKLGIWVRNQRREYRALLQNIDINSGEMPSSKKLPMERIEALDALDFMESGKSKASYKGARGSSSKAKRRSKHARGHRPLKDLSNTMMQRIKQYYDENGHSLVKEADDPELYKWTLSVRRNYRYQALVGENKGRNPLPTMQGAAEERRSSSLSSVSRRRQRPRLSAEKFRILNEVDFVWDMQALAWDKRYQQLKAFWLEYGHCRVPAAYQESPGLGVWVRNQRREYKKLFRNNYNGKNSSIVNNNITTTSIVTTNDSNENSNLSTTPSSSTLTAERLAALEALNFTWCKSHHDSWNKRYKELQQFRKLNGHVDVPETYPDNPALGTWCINQRTYYRKFYRLGEPSGLTQKRVELLEKLEFKWNCREHIWNARKERLKSYFEQHGHIHFSTGDDDNRDLRVWLIRQRFQYNRRQDGLPSPLTEDRIKALEEAIPGFSWKARESDGPSQEDWAKLFDAMREKGLQPGMRPKQHWFEGINPFTMQVKDHWSEQDLWELWHQEEDEEES